MSLFDEWQEEVRKQEQETDNPIKYHEFLEQHITALISRAKELEEKLIEAYKDTQP